MNFLIYFFFLIILHELVLIRLSGADKIKLIEKKQRHNIVQNFNWEIKWTLVFVNNLFFFFFKFSFYLVFFFTVFMWVKFWNFVHIVIYHFNVKHLRKSHTDSFSLTNLFLHTEKKHKNTEQKIHHTYIKNSYA